MDSAKLKSWWASLGVSATAGAAPRDEDDYADMGTAFGLDASFGRSDTAHENAEGRPVARTPSSEA